jgi:hypothetical protein
MPLYFVELSTGRRTDPIASRTAKGMLVHSHPVADGLNIGLLI